MEDQVSIIIPQEGGNNTTPPLSPIPLVEEEDDLSTHQAILTSSNYDLRRERSGASAYQGTPIPIVRTADLFSRFKNYARSIISPNHQNLNNDQQPSGLQQASYTFGYFHGRKPQEASALETHNDQGTSDKHQSMHSPIGKDSRIRKPSISMEDIQTDNLGADHSVSSSSDADIASTHNDLSCEPKKVIDTDEQFMASVCNKIPVIRGTPSYKVLQQTIYRVPVEIRSLDEMAYTPRVVCIGPLFDPARTNTTNLKQMQGYKWSCLSKLISKGNLPNNPDILNRDLLLECLLTEIKKSNTRIRDSYSDNIGISDNELALMMVLDGCFILHLLLKHSERREDISKKKVADEDDMKVIGRLWIWKLVAYDLLLLENQIPFFVIQTLFRLTKNGNEPDDLVACGLRLFSSIHPCRTDASFSTSSNTVVHHLLHLVYLSIIPPLESKHTPENAPLDKSPHWIPSAKELQESGVRFKRRNSGSFFLDIKFRKGVMEIPPLEVHDYSNSLFRNLIAFEQCYPDTRCHITVYAVFMDCLLNTPEDIRLLHLSEILINRMTTDQDAAHFFSRLCNQVHYAFDRSYLRELFVDVNRYRGPPWHKWRAGLFRDYLSNPWVIISVIAATLLLLLTAAQCFFAVYSYFRPPK